MWRLLCWLLGHERMTTSAAKGVCLRCGSRETRRYHGGAIGWEVVAEAPIHGSRA